MIKLVRPSIEYKEKALAFRREFFDSGEDVINGSELLDKIEDYGNWLKMITDNEDSQTVSPDWVVTDTYFAVDEDGKIVGIIDFRHELKGFLIDAGNIGYSVLPSERRKGYATEMLGLVLRRARDIGLTEVVVSCFEDNVPSKKTIINNGGILKKQFEFENEKANKYVIEL